MARTFAEYFARAESVAATMTAESHRKDAMDYCNRAFDCVMDGVADQLLAQPEAVKESEAWRKLYYGRPACHVWADKHAARFAAYPESVEAANRCAALRATIKAAPLQPKKTTPRAAAIAADAAKAKTCQVCGRAIQSNGGVVAHHGYERPGTGWQTGSCMGARVVPLEVSRDVLGVYIQALESRLETLAGQSAEVSAEKCDLFHGWQVRTNPGRWPAQYESKGCTFNRGCFDAMKAAHPDGFSAGETFDRLKAVRLAQIESDRMMVESYRREAQARFDGWTGPTHKFNPATLEWESL